MISNISSSLSFSGKEKLAPRKTLKTLLASWRSGVTGEAKKISLSDLRSRQPVVEDVFSKNSVSYSPQGIMTYLRNVEPVVIENKEVEGIVDIAAGVFKNSKATSINAYGSAKVISSSAESTYVGGSASLQGGDHRYLNIQESAKVSSVNAVGTVLYGKGKLSNSSAKEYIEANDATTLENVKAPKIIMNGWFSSLKGKNNECDELKADFVWRLLHLDFRKSIAPKGD